jgi:glycosyltransferase involved in cell wall biosynthesis
MPESHPNAVVVSVIIPAYNSAPYIRETLESVLSQTHPPLEVIVVDDGSSDDTAAIVQSYNGRVRLLQQEHRGVSAARNLGIRQAQGDYVAFLDSDDLWLPEKLERQSACILEKQVAWVSCGADFFDTNSGKIFYEYRKKLYEGDILEKEFVYTFIRSPTPLVKRTVFEDVGYFNEEYEARIGEDKDMWLRIAARYPLGVVDEVLALKREHPASTMNVISWEELLSIQLRGVDRAVARQPERLNPLKNRLLAKIYLNHGATLIKRCEYDQARPLISQALRLNPYNINTWAYWLALHSGAIGRSGYRLIRKSTIRPD